MKKRNKGENVFIILVILFFIVISYWLFYRFKLYQEKIKEKILFIREVSDEIHQLSSWYVYVNHSDSEELKKIMRLSNSICKVAHFFNHDTVLEQEKRKLAEMNLGKGKSY